MRLATGAWLSATEAEEEEGELAEGAGPSEKGVVLEDGKEHTPYRYDVIL